MKIIINVNIKHLQTLKNCIENPMLFSDSNTIIEWTENTNYIKDFVNTEICLDTFFQLLDSTSD